MKVGIFFTGFFREVPFSRENYTQFLESENDVSVYIATWEGQNHREEKDVGEVWGNALKGYEVQNYLSWQNNTSEGQEYTEFVSRWNQSLSNLGQSPIKPTFIGQYRAWYRAFTLCDIETFNKFDVVLFSRQDLNFMGKPRIPIERNEGGIHVNAYSWVDPSAAGIDKDVDSILRESEASHTQFRYITPYSCSDHLAWGKPEYMSKFLTWHVHQIEMMDILFDSHQYVDELVDFRVNHTLESLLVLYLKRWKFNSVREALHSSDKMNIIMDGQLSQCESVIPHPSLKGYDYYNLANGTFGGPFLLHNS